ncbi:hypothetical protein E4T56_gene1404 [Termitomyces sp. T112]|nr:hypothetical protein E4T56_gene1404 [Termitomyces sp. T112]
MITANISHVLSKTYDFVIVGGGTAGLVLAERLSENPSFTVAVLEAGDNTINDPMTSIPAPYGRQLGNPKYDWGFVSAKQKYSNGMEYPWARGKGLGGTSCINFLEWSLPPAVDVDVLERLGNRGWNWNEFYRYSRKIERFHPPSKEVTDLFPHTYGDDRGTSGPLQITIPPHVYTVDAILRETFLNTGLTALHDPYQGEVNGAWFPSATINPKTWTRSNSATAYLVPAQDRPNLTVLTQALVCRVLFAQDSSGGDLIATGVEFIHQGTKHVLSANKEVILSAGTIKSPQILELSGIGNSDILSRVDVQTRIELPGVGENLQDHIFVPVSYELDPSAKHQTFDFLGKPELLQKAAELYAEGKGPLRNALSSFAFFSLNDMQATNASIVATKIEEDMNNFRNTPGIGSGLREQIDIQLDSLHSKASPEIEIASLPMLYSAKLKPEGDKTYFTLLAFVVHPLSRGTIHSRSNNPRDNPDIDPHYFERDSDMEILIQGIKYIRTMAQTEPMKSACVGEELQPGSRYTNDEELREYIKDTLSTSWHSLGTCSMLPRDKQGVVDSELKVYGTKNLRIADISIIPLHIAAHTQAIAYVIGEKASDIILSAHQST